MKISGIIAEYNPFHNGHRYQIEKTRENGTTHIVAVMSGNYVQRGEPAVFSKWARAQAAVMGGVDLVIDLPTPYALSSAPDFAYAGVFMLSQLGAEELSFGSECGNLPSLYRGAQVAAQAERSLIFRTYYQSGISYPKALRATVKELYGEEDTALLDTPNNLLAVEYIKAATAVNPDMKFFTIPRTGAQHDAIQNSGNIASGLFLRSLLFQKDLDALSPYLETDILDIYRKEISCKKAPVQLEQIEDILLYRLRQMNTCDFASIQGVCEGMENRLYQVSRNALSLSSLFSGLQTKRYTDARIRRIVLSCLLDIKKGQFPKVPAYLRVLACNSRGADILRTAKEKSKIPIISKFSERFKSQCPLAILENQATDLYSLASPHKFPCGRELTEPIFFNK